MYFFCPLTLNLLPPDLILAIHKVHVFCEAFSFLAVTAMVTGKMPFSISMATIIFRKEFLLSQEILLSQQLFKPSLERWSQIEKDYSKKLSQRVIFYPIAKSQDPINRDKKQ